MAKKILIVGAGYSGCAVAANLLRLASGDDIEVILVEKSRDVGLGPAYGTTDECHLLNVAAKSMGFYADQPNHFLDWLSRNGISAQPNSYMPRKLFGRYVQETFAEVRAAAKPGKIQVFQDEVLGLSAYEGGAQVKLASGKEIRADRVVLAIGNFPPADFFAEILRGIDPNRYLRNPWVGANWDEIAAAKKSVLLIGTALTSIDIVLSLKQRGFEGSIHALSRRGFLPQVHKSYTSVLPFSESEVSSAKDLRSVLRLLRRKGREAMASPEGNWRSAVDGFRPHTQRVWAALPTRDRKRFLRHLVGFWNQHRSRMPVEVAETVFRLRDSGQLVIHAGRIKSVSMDRDGLRVFVQKKGTNEQEPISCDLIVNCTGPSRDFSLSKEPLIQSLIASNMATPDPIGMAIKVSSSGALIGRDGNVSKTVFTVGAPRVGDLWESVALPELKVQADQLARTLLSSL